MKFFWFIGALAVANYAAMAALGSPLPILSSFATAFSMAIIIACRIAVAENQIKEPPGRLAVVVTTCLVFSCLTLRVETNKPLMLIEIVDLTIVMTALSLGAYYFYRQS